MHLNWGIILLENWKPKGHAYLKYSQHLPGGAEENRKCWSLWQENRVETSDDLTKISLKIFISSLIYSFIYLYGVYLTMISLS
jgi:hypothetical protein